MNSLNKYSYHADALKSSGHFPELATTLFYWVEQLDRALAERDVKHVYFLAREGQPLMRMFDLYCERAGSQVISHYLEVSRRATLLPSLKILEGENFDTLFRQYRRVSLLEFLSSLGLEAHVKQLRNLLSVPEGAELEREEDFPTSSMFKALKSLPQFVELYENERRARRSSFIAYLKELSGGTLPAQLVVVDVGWKGTIQDNLYALLCRDGDTPVKSVVGYYVGLVAEGAVTPSNTKNGLLFSAVGGRTPGFYTFNENRALFEIILAADHGSIVSYETDCDGHARPIRGVFEEQDMLCAEVFPVQDYVMGEFCRLVDQIQTCGIGQVVTYDEVVQAHARMVFQPTPQERVWLSSVFHVENYGVFERSYFSGPEKETGLFARLSFLLHLALTRDVGTLGFWPWRTLYERGGALCAGLYALIRRWQG